VTPARSIRKVACPLFLSLSPFLSPFLSLFFPSDRLRRYADGVNWPRVELQAYSLPLQQAGPLGVVSHCARPTRVFSDRALREHRAPPMARSIHVLPRFHLSLIREWPDCPSLRASNEHLPSVRVLRARRMVWPLSSRPSKLARLPLQRVACLVSYCARPTRGVCDHALREHRRLTGYP
jgi:hypothetical protein